MKEFLDHFNDLNFGKAILIKMLRDRNKINRYKCFKTLFYIVMIINVILLLTLFTISTNKAIDKCVSGGLSREICEKELK